MTSDLLRGLLAANLAAAVAVLAVLALRRPARALLGARLAYALWLIVPAAMLATLVPARTVVVAAPPAAVIQTLTATPTAMAPAQDVFAAAPAAQPIDIAAIGLAIWLAGAVFFGLRLILAQRAAMAQFGRITRDPGDRRLSRATRDAFGPALVGMVKPRIVLPADFESRFDAEERRLILAHERAHLAGAHPLTNGAIAAMKAVNWFNPLIHAAAHAARVDQELACDAAVIAQRPHDRQAYGRTLLKSQLNNTALPLGCYWPGRAAGEITERIEMLQKKSPSRLRLLSGAGLVAAVTAGVSLAAWAAQPAQERLGTAQSTTPASAISDVLAPATALQPVAAARPQASVGADFCLTNACDGATMAPPPVVAPPGRPLYPRNEAAIAAAVRAGNSGDLIRAGATPDEVLAMMQSICDQPGQLSCRGYPQGARAFFGVSGSNGALQLMVLTQPADASGRGDVYTFTRDPNLAGVAPPFQAPITPPDLQGASFVTDRVDVTPGQSRAIQLEYVLASGEKIGVEEWSRRMAAGQPAP